MIRHSLRVNARLCASLCVALVFLLQHVVMAQSTPVFRNPKASLDERVANLLKALTLEEKITLIGYSNDGVPRLGIPAYNWWNEALHGVARAGTATVFPQAIAMAATFNDELIEAVADVISTEARAKYNLSAAHHRHQQYMGLTFWSPNINIFRDPRWGRGQETYGEDPYLTSRMGVSFVHGLQGDDPAHFLKTSAAAKHLAVHSGPEANRHQFNAVVDEKDLRETYLYAFKHLVDGGVESVMCAYNRVNGEPCCTGPTLLKDILRNEWHFSGHVVTDCGALDDIYLRHKALPSAAVVAAEAVKSGINMDCSNLLQKDLQAALDQNLITEDDITKALAPSLRTLFKLGVFDAKDHHTPYDTLGTGSIHTAAHVALARQAAQQSMVLLKNDKHLLPIDKEQYESIVVAGSNAASADALLANYHGVSPSMVTFIEGITEAAGPETGVQYDLGCNYTDTTHFGGTWAASLSDLSIAVIGLTPVLEGEEGDAFLAAHGGDKLNLDIPAAHVAFVKALRKSIGDKPLIAIVTAGSDVDISAIEPYADAIILAWYPGEMGGAAAADLIFGKVSPSGKLPVTFYSSLDDLPAYESYAMQGRTYRYYDGKVQYPFGFGLSYTTFTYDWKQKPATRYRVKSQDSVTVSLVVKNTGKFDGDEVVQAYIRYPKIDRMPVKELRQFKRVHVAAGGEQTVTLSIPLAELRKWDLKKNRWELYKGTYQVVLGSDSRDEKLVGEFVIK